MGCQMDTLFYQYTQCDFDFFFNSWINNTLNKVDFLIENPILSIIFLLNSIVHFIPIPIPISISIFPQTPSPLLRVAPPSFFLGQLDLGRRGEPGNAVQCSGLGFVPTTLGDNLKSWIRRIGTQQIPSALADNAIWFFVK